MVFLPSYLFMTPTFTCAGQSGIKEVDACPIITTCTIDQVHTITNYVGIYCDDKYIRNSILSAEFVGSVTGLILLSMLADKLGRKIIIVSTLFISVIGSMSIHDLISPHDWHLLQNICADLHRDHYDGLWRLLTVDGIIFVLE